MASQSVWAAALARVEGQSQPSTEDEPHPSLFPQYVDDPVGFCRDVLRYPGEDGPEPIRLWHRQEAIARDVATKPRTSVRSGHKVGKTVLVAVIALWWVLTRPRGRAILTSAGESNVKGQIWMELRAIWNASGGNARFKPTQGIPLDPATGLKIDDVRFIYGRTTSEHDAEKMAGYSGDQILFCIDEASGFPTKLFEAVEGNMAGGGAVLATGNPTQVSGWFYDSFHHDRRMWSTHHIDSRTTPNATGEGEPIPGLAAAPYCAMMLEKYGKGDVAKAEEHPVYAVRVAGEFPTMGSRQVVPQALIKAGVDRWPTAKLVPSVLELGVDVARFGEDDSVIKPRRGHYAWPSIEVHGFDSFEVADEVLKAITRYINPGEATLPIVKVDASGGHGSGVIDYLRRTGKCIVVPVDAGSGSSVLTPAKTKAFFNLRAELWWTIREWLEAGGAMPPEPDLEAELRAPVYDFTAKMSKRVESKDDIKKRLGRSPDRADALALAVYTPPWAYAQAALTQPDVSTVPSRGRPEGLNSRGRGGGAW